MYPFSRKIFAATVLLSMNIMAMPLYAADYSITPNKKEFSLKLGASRVIYHSGSNGAMLSVSNQQDYPILVQGKVYAEDKKSASPFIVTPPLFRLEAGQQSRMRIVRTSVADAPDRESMQWICISGIPPKDTDVWAKGNTSKPATAVTVNLEISTHSCIKLLVRPSGVKGMPTDVAADLTWKRQGSKIYAHNGSPFYMNLSSVTVGGKPVNDLNYVAPFAERSFTLPKRASGKVEWKIITDVGGESRVFQSPTSI
ncbi:putative gram-negative pili assembly chaperone [Serratia symbiotica str. Tucson]|uniref:Putative gram-negative pili assembly chaperone n=1 Tax=Serratia symbiotica str. Tucson TaxID=914128 RepID=E9CJV4_9GAMM|nr:fimbria/pilus periplasmic chaperone [Serratia symbiotica]EFW13162.1 putative gram-negative pili assembly chaperone [Serratia symbiotica str. Tucson]